MNQSMQPVSSESATILPHLEKVLKSQTFAHADRLREFLRFIVEKTVSREAASLKETVIGISVFGRSPDYDPKLDNIVRTSARRVRLKLDEYYLTEGASDLFRIELHKGSYVPLFHSRDVVPVSHQPPALLSETPSSPEPVSAKHSYKLRLYGLSAACLLMLVSLVVSHVRHQDDLPWHSTPFTVSSGHQTFPDFSPDGKRIAFTWSGPEVGPRQVYMQELGTLNPERFTNGASEAIRPAWSPDGTQIAYLQPGLNGNNDVYIKTVSGKSQRRVTSLIAGDPWLCNEPRLSWSPTAAVLASVEKSKRDGTCGVVLIDLVSGQKRWLTHPPVGQFADLEPAVSPDGKWIAFLRLASASISDIFVVPSTGGTARRVTFDNREVRGFTWSPNGSAFIVASRRNGNFLNLWSCPLGRRTAARLTESPSNLGFPAVSRQGDRLAYVAYRDDSNIWKFTGKSNLKWIESSGTDMGGRYSPDGRKITFISDRAGNQDLWIADEDGQRPVRLTDFLTFPVGSPSWSPDSRQIAVDVRLAGQSHVYLTDAQPGRHPNRLTTWEANEAVPSWSSNGKFIYFASTRAGAWNIYRATPDGGSPVQVTRDGGFRSIESPDGRFLFFTKTATPGIWRLPLTDGATEELLLADFPAAMWSDWTLGPLGFYYLLKNDTVSARDKPGWIKLLRTGQNSPELIGETDKAPNGGGLSVSPDGKSFLYSQFDRTGSDILLLEH